MIGRLRERVSLLSPTRSSDAAGGAALSFSEIARVWAEVRSTRVGEAVVSDVLASVTQFVVRIRWRIDVGPGWRIAYGARTLRVVGAQDPDGRSRWLDLSAEEER